MSTSASTANLPSYTIGDFLLSFADLGEGFDGEYDPADPMDTPLLRLDVSRSNSDDIQVDGGSWCTGIPASTPSDRLLDILKHAAAWVESALPERGERRTFERLSWLTPAYAGGKP